MFFYLVYNINLFIFAKYLGFDEILELKIL